MFQPMLYNIETPTRMPMQTTPPRRTPPTASRQLFLTRLRRLLLLSAACACATALVLSALWVSAGVIHVVDGEAGDVVTRVALKESVSDASAQKLAQRLESETPGLKIDVIDEAEARTLLSMQEPWMKDLPTVEIGRLPTLLEIRHPARLESPAAVIAFNQSLQQLPESDFIEFNATGYEGMVSMLRNVRLYAGLLAKFFCVLAALGYALTAGLSGGKGAPGLARSIARSAVVTTLGGVVGLFVHLWLTHFATAGIYRLPPLSTLSVLGVFGVAFLITLIAGLSGGISKQSAEPLAPPTEAPRET